MNAPNPRWLRALLVGGLLGGAGCAHQPPIPPVPQVDLSRFMGDWYVIAHIPSPIERRVFNAVESYALRDDGKVQTTFRYRNGAFDALLKTMRALGSVRPGSGNAVWGMQFVWPIQAEYVVVHLDADYSQAIIGRSKRDYAWIMARTPTLPAAEYDALVQRLRDLGYSLEHLRVVPQQWPEDAGARPE